MEAVGPDNTPPKSSLSKLELPDPGIEPTSLMSPVLAGGFFTTSTTSEAPQEDSNMLVELKTNSIDREVVKV